MNQKILIPLIIIIFTGAGFFAGMKYQQSKTFSGFRAQFNGQPGNQVFVQNGARVAGPSGSGSPIRARIGGGQMIGEIISVDDQGLSLKLPDGSSKIILLGKNVSINKASEASKDDLKTGEKIAVFGTQNDDGSITAQNIQLNPHLPSVSPVQAP